MTKHHNQDRLSEDLTNLLEYGLAENLLRIADMLFNAAMILERNAHLRSDPYQRTVDSLSLRVTQTCESDEPFRPSMLKVAIADMYIQGVSTRRVTKAMEKLCGHEVTSV